MTEHEYILATNLAKIRSAKDCVHSLMANFVENDKYVHDFHIPEDEFQSVARLLAKWEEATAADVHTRVDLD